jgi:hypothetical protein
MDKLVYKRKGSVGRGLLIGFVSGAILGGLIGLASGNDEEEFSWDDFPYYFEPRTAGEKAVSTGAALGILGGIIGGVVGALAKKSFTINRSPSAMKELNTTLLERVYSK